MARRRGPGSFCSQPGQASTARTRIARNTTPRPITAQLEETMGMRTESHSQNVAQLKARIKPAPMLKNGTARTVSRQRRNRLTQVSKRSKGQVFQLRANDSRDSAARIQYARPGPDLKKSMEK